MDAFDTDLPALIMARDVLQKQIDEHVAVRRRELLGADAFYRERKTRRLAAYFSELGFRIVSYVGKEQVLAETRAANFLFKIKEIAVPIFKNWSPKAIRKYRLSWMVSTARTRVRCCSCAMLLRSWGGFGRSARDMRCGSCG